MSLLPRKLRRRRGGFTLIELMVVLVIIAVLVTLVSPRYFNSIRRSNETVLHANLAMTRAAIDKFYGDTGKYPDQLSDLVEKRYLQKLPWDPIAESSSGWVIVAPPDGAAGAVYNVFSSAQGDGNDGTPYGEW